MPLKLNPDLASFPGPRRSSRAHPERAFPHIPRVAHRARKGGFAAALALALGAWACSEGGPAAQGPPQAQGTASASRGPAIAELVAAFTPPDPTSTSDRMDAWYRDQRAVLERLSSGEESLGLEALEAFRRSSAEPEPVRAALLQLAARTAPQTAAPLLEQLVLEYDPAVGLGLRTEAVRLLAESAPERAVGLLEPLVRTSSHKRTLPPQEALVRSYAEAARRLSRDPSPALADVAIDLAQPPDARYVAIEELGRSGGLAARKALEVVLVESSADGYVRRKAAQALQGSLPKEELCPILLRVADRETDPIFLVFLADMIEKNGC
ncbi:MAG TPA: HEAT repeat domain-containing protein [Planctomycetota bacterium]|nr:HEAT repeat domain-containing protein [Planctomycetota bacterium]